MPNLSDGTCPDCGRPLLREYEEIGGHTYLTTRCLSCEAPYADTVAAAQREVSAFQAFALVALSVIALLLGLSGGLVYAMRVWLRG